MDKVKDVLDNNDKPVNEIMAKLRTMNDQEKLLLEKELSKLEKLPFNKKSNNPKKN